MSTVLVKHGEHTEIAKIFSVSDRTVRDALKGKTRSNLSARIRKCAIERGGAEVESTPKQKI